MTRDSAISRSVLSAQVKERLLEAILDGRSPPGARIVETRVARELGTSQAPVREALRDLEALGVVENSPFRGARVRQPSIEELLEAFEWGALPRGPRGPRAPGVRGPLRGRRPGALRGLAGRFRRAGLFRRAGRLPGDARRGRAERRARRVDGGSHLTL